MKKRFKKKRVITKIWKSDENNQYVFGVTKPLPKGCIKQNLDTSWRTFNLLLQNVSYNDQIGNFYVLDIEFDHTKATEKQIVYNDIFPSIIEKQEIIDPGARSVYQLLEQYSVTEKGNPRSYRATKKARATLFKKKKKKKKSTNLFRKNLLCH